MRSTTRALVLGFLDLVLIQVAGLVAIGLRFDFSWPGRYLLLFETSFLLLAGLRLAVYYAFGLYNRVWRYASLPEFRAVVAAGTISSAWDWTFLHLLRPADGFPRSVTLLMWVFNIALAGGLRVSLRMSSEWSGLRSAGRVLSPRKLLLRARRRDHPAHCKSRVLLVGAGQAGSIVAKELNAHPELPFAPVGFLDDDPGKQRRVIAGLRVLGPISDLPRVVERLGVQEVIVALPSARGQVMRQVVDLCKSAGVHVKTVPGIYEILDGKVAMSRIRPVDISDLLRREEVRIDPDKAAGYLRQARVLVTGAGGSIGSELCRQIARLEPAQLVLLGHGEHSIHEILEEVRRDFNGLETVPVIADIRDAGRIGAVFASYRPEVVFHAAAHKHVYLMEMSLEEAFSTNVVGTWVVARAAAAHGTRKFVLISTDKAVNPVSVMGATKQVAEVVVRMLNGDGPTRFIVVRFGNVLGSRGSVIPLFRKQIARGGPVTVTHPGMKRYFMTIPEATQLVLEAGAIGQGGEVFVLDMGEPVSILETARDLIRLSGLDPDRDVRIEFSRPRPGEKLVEQLASEDERLLPTEHPRILMVDGSRSPALLSKPAAGTGTAASSGDAPGLALWSLIEAYREAAAAQEDPGQAFIEWLWQSACGARDGGLLGGRSISQAYRADSRG